MLSDAMNISYKPLEIQSDYSVSNTRREIYTQSLQNELKKVGGAGGAYVEWYLPPESYIQAHSYLTSNAPSPFSFKNTLEEALLTSKATSQMQDFLNTPNLASFRSNRVSLNNNDSKNTFGGYKTDKYGFMGEEFLKVANLPSDYKIHKNVLSAFNDFYVTARNSEFESIDLIAGIAYANKTFNALLKEDKEYYTKEEIMQDTKESKGVFYEEDFESLLMQDYKNKEGAFKKEGIMLMYALKSNAFYNVKSPYTIKRENKEDYNSFIISNNSIEKTSQEKAKEMKDAFNDYYLKALEDSQKEMEHKDNISIPNRIIQESPHFKDKIAQLEFNQRSGKLKDTSAVGEWIKVKLH